VTPSYGSIGRALASLRGDVLDAPAPDRTVRYRDRSARGIAPVADLYVPRRRTGASVVLVHGGAFVIGSRRMKPMRFLAARLHAAGIAVCAIDYRLMFRGGRLAQATDDVAEAAGFWCDRALEHDLDPDAVTMVGLSAGATLALLAGTHVRAARVARIACAFGLYDVAHLRGVSQLFPRLLFATPDRSRWIASAPYGARQPPVPTLLLHGGDDELVPAEQARRLAAHRDRLGLPTRLVVYPGAPHGFFNVECDAREAAVREIVDHCASPRGYW
jgi:acetyl esterase/lipase